MNVLKLTSLLMRWQEEFARGRDLSPAELCADCPELLPALQAALEPFRHVQQLCQAVGPEEGVPPASTQQAPALVLTVEAGPAAEQERSFRLSGHATFVVGRDPDKVHFALPADPHFSRTHFLIEINPPLCRLQDLGSKNGTLVNGVKVSEADLRDGDLISGGTVRLRVRLEGPGWDAGPPSTVTLAASPQTASALAAPASLPQVPGYRLLEELGRGGMGVVYKAVGEADGEVVALKTIQPAAAPSRQAVQRFLREIDVLRALSHPGIVRFRASGESGGLVWFAMEYVAGRDAAAVVRAEGPQPVGKAVGWAVQLLEALGQAHSLGFVHRDVKPGNLLVARGGVGQPEVVKLADFGLARAYQASALSGLTMTSTTGGTPEFMAPEQALDFRSASPAADQYGAAATLYYLLSGQYVFGAGGQLTEKIRRLLNDQAVPLGRVRPDLPAGLVAVVMRALARRPEERFADVQALQRALGPYAGG